MRIEDTDIWALTDDRLADFRNRRIGFVYQFASLLPTLRIVDNVALPALLDRAQGPAGAYEPPPSPRPAGLSRSHRRLPGRDFRRRTAAGGHRARSYQFAALLLADEPTSDLDEETERQIMDEFRTLNREHG